MKTFLLNKSQNLLVKNVITLLFVLFTSTLFSQGNTCATATTIAVNTTCVNTAYNVTSAFTDSGVAICTGTSYRDGWYTFTTGATTTSITIEGTTNRRMGLALYSGACASPVQVACVNNNAASETLTATVTPSTTYKLRIFRSNNDNNNDMTGNICVYSAPAASGNFTCATATALPCGTTALAGTTVGSTGSPVHGTTCTMSDYGAWYTFVGDGQLTTISSTAGTGYDHEMSISCLLYTSDAADE